MPRCSSLCTLRSGLASACALDDSLENMMACCSDTRCALEPSFLGLRGSPSLAELLLLLPYSTGDLSSLGERCQTRCSGKKQADRGGRAWVTVPCS